MPHLLKRLELNGFKSFAGKTVLEFPKGITAIVGPNGSGKSNVIDAIRWLLGERDSKSLRGAKSEDLIFAGTPKRPRVGQAQASLHFENHPFDGPQGRQKFFPVDFEEVSVMREVSRDGEGNYFLNKSEVRLKDIIDFFAAARLGSRGMTVITQGNSDMFIRANPAERREMIEEVLGLKEYQLKKHGAELRLKHAEINLEKTQALIEEIAPHLKSLKRQTGRFEKREEYEKELRDLEAGFFGSQLKDITAKLSETEADIRAHERKQTELAATKNLAEDKLKHAEANEPKERAELKSLKETIRSIEEKRNELSRELAKLETRMEAASKSSEGVSGEGLVLLVRESKAALERALDDSANLENAVRSVIKNIDKVLSGGGEAGSPSPELKKEFDRVMKTLSDIEEEVAALRDKEKSLEKNQETFYVKFRSALEEVQRSRNSLDEWTRSEQAKTLDHERLRMRREELGRLAAQAGRRLEEFAHVNTGDGIDLADTERKMFRLRGELAAIGEIDEALMNEAKTTEERHVFLTRESEDLAKAVADLKELIKDLNQKISTQFSSALHKINEEFQKFFELMFGGGSAKLRLEKNEAKKMEAGDEESLDEAQDASLEAEEDTKEPGIEIQVSLPRKRVSTLDSLSGGERSLVGIATLFALISVSPPPFLVLDEIDAPLDERNARRFAEMLKEFSKETQFIIVTHNRATMEAADVLYGVTLDPDGTSKVISMKFADEALAKK